MLYLSVYSTCSTLFFLPQSSSVQFLLYCVYTCSFLLSPPRRAFSLLADEANSCGFDGEEESSTLAGIGNDPI